MASFLKSKRFWALVMTSASVVLVDPSFAGQLWYISLGKFFGLVGAGFIAIRTVDRATEQKILAAGVSSGEIKAQDVLPIPPPKSDDLK